MKKVLIKLSILLLLIVASVTQVQAYNMGGCTLYVDNYSAQWSSIRIYMWNGDWNTNWTFTQISGTDYWQCAPPGNYSYAGYKWAEGAAGSWSGGQSNDITADGAQSSWHTKCYTLINGGWTVPGLKNVAYTSTTTAANVLAGNGGSSTPYIVKPGTSISVKLEGDLIDSDCSKSFKFGNGSASTTATKTVISSAVKGTAYSMEGFTGSTRSSYSSRYASAGTLYFKTAYNMSASVSGSHGSVSITAGGSYVYSGNTSFTITASPDTGYEVDTWSVSGGTKSGSGNTITVTASNTADCSVTVTFKEIPPDPAVSFSAAKTSGINVGETVRLTATGSNASNIQKYIFYEGSTAKKTVTTTSTTATYDYIPTTTGNKTVKVVMYYNSGSNTVESSSVSLTLNTPSVSLAVKSGSPTEIYLNETTTIMKATPSNVGAGVTPSYVFTDQASPAVSSGSQTSTEWTYTPGKTGTKTMKVTMSVGGSTYTATATVYVYEHKTIYVHDVSSWGTMKLYLYNNSTSTSKSDWPGSSCSNVTGSSSWYVVTLDSKWPNFILNNNSNKQLEGRGHEAYSSYDDDTYWYTTFRYTGTYGDDEGKDIYGLTKITVSDPTLAAVTKVKAGETQLTLKGEITNCGGDGSTAADMKAVGFRIGSTDYTADCTDGVYFYKTITGLTANTSYSVVAYAENIHGRGTSASSSHKTLAHTTHRIHVRSTAQPYMYAWTDNPACSTGYISNGTYGNTGTGAMTSTGVTSVLGTWYYYDLAEQYDKFLVTVGSGTSNWDTNKTADQTNPKSDDNCYWYWNASEKSSHGGQTFGTMGCPIVDPTLMIESTAGGGSYDYHTMTVNGGNVEKSLTLTAKSTYKFKVVYNSDFYTRTSSSDVVTRSNYSNIAFSVLDGEDNETQIVADVAGSYKFSFNTSTKKLSVTYQEAYTVTFGYGTGGSDVTASATSAGGSITSGDYVAAGDNVTFTQTPSSAGYTFAGWYDAQAGGSAVPTMGVEDNVLNSIGGNANVYAQYTPNNYTVTFDATTNGGTCETASKSVTYDAAYGTLPTATPPGADSFIGWYTTPSGEGTQVTAETLVSTADNHILYARYESTFEVTVKFMCGSDVLYPQTKVDASASSLNPTVTAPEILGYEFSSWSVVSGTATVTPSNTATATVSASEIATIRANYTAVPTVYFKNNLDWDTVYVTFDAYFNGSGNYDDAPGNNGKPYYQMTQLGSSDIFYCRIPDAYTANNYQNWKNGIAFDNVNYNKKATTTHTGDMQAFYGGEFTGRGDFDPKATMFIPYNGQTETRNTGTFYKRGCWIQYNTNYSGYEVRVNTKVQGGGGTSTNVQLKSSIAGSTEFTAKVNLTTANYTYGVMLYKDYQKNNNDLWYTNVNDNDHIITSATTTLPWGFEPCDDSWQRCQVHTEATGEYIFTVSFATGIPMVDIEYPVNVGDFRLVYKDRATWNTTHGASWKQVSPVFKKKANRIDTVSFYISYGHSPSLELQKCTYINPSTSEETWTKQSDVSLSAITTDSVYNFKVTQSADGNSAIVEYAGIYTGKYYIRTDASDGGWNDYKSTNNTMIYSEYSRNHGGSSGPYSHYHMSHVNSGQNIKFVIANDYNVCLTDTLVDDDYASEWIETEANVRFTWNQANNQIHRAYIRGSGKLEDRFLVLEGDANMFDINGNALTGANRVHDEWGHYLNDNEMNFIDDQNWVYEASIQAKPGAKVKLTALFNDEVQYFYGDEDETYQILGGSGSDMYELRIVYDFKTNRLVTALIPAGAISSAQAINTDVMIVRYHQGTGVGKETVKQITFSGSGALSKVKTVYGAMKFNKYRLNNKGEDAPHNNLGLSNNELGLYWIAFPFDVKLNEVFGFGTYGKHWIIEYYDGKGRAEKGYWKDSPSNWKFVTKAMRDTFTLKANVGYLLALDLSELTLESTVWSYGVENVYLYFPSVVNIENINATNKTVDIDQTGYECTIGPRFAGGDDRRVKDSYWHVIGVPSFANYNSALTDPDSRTIDWTSGSMPYLYEWNKVSNSLSITSSATFAFKATWAYMVQYAGASIYWSSVNTPVAVAARNRSDYKSVYEFRLELQQANEKVDQTFVSLRDNENVTTEFDFNFDLSKEMNTNKSNIYTVVTSVIDNEQSITETAGNCLPLETEQMTTVPVGVVAKTDGTYTFAMPDGTEGISVTLVDNGTVPATHTDLSIDGAKYEVTLPAGTYDGRFFLQIDPRNAATMIDLVGGEGEDVQAAKILRNGIMYIQRGEKLFDATGSRVE